MAKRVRGSGTSSGREGPSVNTLGLTKATPSRRKEEAPVEREYVGIDLHRRRSVIVRKNAAGVVRGWRLQSWRQKCTRTRAFQ